MKVFFALFVSTLFATTPFYSGSPTVINPAQEGFASRARIAVDGSGNALVVYLFDSSVYSVYRPQGGEWEDPIQVSTVGSENGNSSVAIDQSGNAIALWVRFGDVEDTIQTAYRPVGGSWGAVEDLASDSLLGVPQLAMNADGAAIAIWSEGVGDDAAIKSSYRPAGGAWGAVQTLGMGGSATSNRIAIDGSGNALALWNQLDGGIRRVYSSYRDVNAGTWAAEGIISPAGLNLSVDSLAMNSAGNAVAGFYELDVTETYVSYRVEGESWETFEKISPDGETTTDPAVGIDALGNATAIWSEGSLVSAYRTANGAWEYQGAFDSRGLPDTGEIYALVVNPGGDALAVWDAVQSLVGTDSVRGSYRPLGGNWLSQFQQITPLDESWAFESIALNSNGNAFIAMINPVTGNVGVSIGSASSLVYWGSRKIRVIVSSP